MEITEETKAEDAIKAFQKASKKFCESEAFHWRCAMDVISRADLRIKELQAEVDRLMKNIELLKICKEDLPEIVMQVIKAETYKELAEALKSEVFGTEHHLDKYFRRGIDRVTERLIGELNEKAD
jgi:TnpA family transposase